MSYSEKGSLIGTFRHYICRVKSEVAVYIVNFVDDPWRGKTPGLRISRLHLIILHVGEFIISYPPGHERAMEGMMDPNAQVCSVCMESFLYLLPMSFPDHFLTCQSGIDRALGCHLHAVPLLSFPRFCVIDSKICMPQM